MSGWRVLGDWGSTNLRLWRQRGGTIDGRSNGPGIVGLADPATALREAIAPWLADGAPDAIALAGMAGARGGLREAGYAPCPLAVSDWRKAATAFELDGVPVRIAAGCADGVEDVMRGEETQLFGALALRPDLATGRHLAILPGTHSKWAWIEEGAITGFRTFFTGELYALLRGSSLLSLGGAPAAADDAGFAAGVAKAKASPGVIGKLFTARAAQLREGRSPAWAASYLSGLLIAGEIAEMAAVSALPRGVTIIGDAALAERYAPALATFNLACERLDGEACALAGLELLNDD